MVKILVIVGSSRAKGNTYKFSEKIFATNIDSEIIELCERNIGCYDYQHKNIYDDFIPIAEKMVKSDIIVFATPIYWYTMSGIMKIFFDRCLDLITIRKDLGKKLKDKKMYLITTSAGFKLPSGFETPFKGFASYLDIKYMGSFHACYQNMEMSEMTMGQIDALSKKIFTGIQI